MNDTNVIRVLGFVFLAWALFLTYGIAAFHFGWNGGLISGMCFVCAGFCWLVGIELGYEKKRGMTIFQRIKDLLTSHYEVILCRTEKTDSALPSLVSLLHCKKDRDSVQLIEETGIWIVGSFRSRRRAEKRAKQERERNLTWAVKLMKFSGNMAQETLEADLKEQEPTKA